MALSASLGLNSLQPVNMGLNPSAPSNNTPINTLDPRTMSQLIENSSQRNAPIPFSAEKVTKAMELIIALGL